MTEAVKAAVMGWRKLGAWALVFALCAYVTFAKLDVPDNAVDMIKWVTAFFFGSNAFVHLAKNIGVKVVKE